MRVSYSGQMMKDAQADITDFIGEHCIPSFESRGALFQYARQNLVGAGLVLEFGVAHGHSIRELARLYYPRTVHGFDSFEGLPEDGPDGRFDKGTFAVPDGLPDVPSNVNLVVGLFQDTLPGFLAQLVDPHVLFVHVDSDLYSSAEYILGTLESFGAFGPGTLIQFDEYLEPWFWPKGEHTAFQEFLEGTGWLCSYLGYCQGHLLVRLV